MGPGQVVVSTLVATADHRKKDLPVPEHDTYATHHDDDLDVGYVLSDKIGDLTGGFTLVPNRLLADPTLSGVALGIALYILSSPAGTPYDAESLAAKSREDVAVVTAALEQLKARGHLPRR
ncbi:hypothetical protein ACIGO8_14755 [Streptomyces sp. NPDC053493]|uniref:hypothetical protein n=1 Tax=Streptomyces sp. NPDC053493 TaxID=3365705 RepID=UPI0037D87F6B